MEQVPLFLPPRFNTTQRAQLDIGNDNKLEINQDLSKGSVKRTFQLGVSAVDIRIVTQGTLSQSDYSYGFHVCLTVNPDTPLKIVSYGNTCGLKLSMSGVVDGCGHTVSCKVEGGFVMRGGILLLGLQPAGIPLPATPCSILVNPVLTLPFSDSNGTSTFVLNTPWRVDGVFYVQAVSAHSAFGYTSFRTSNGIMVDGR